MARDIVLFIGAGFSYHAGLPTMAQFGEVSRRELSILNRHGDRLALGRVREAGDTFDRFQKYCKRADGTVATDADNMESVFCIAESLQESGVPDVDIDGNRFNTHVLLRQIHLWLWHIYNRCQPVDTPAQGEPYKEFMELLRPKAPQLSVLTTNYDIIFEYFAWQAKMHCWYPFSRLTPQRDLQILQCANSSDSFVGLASMPENPMVCKLHGGTNLFEVTQDGRDFLGVASTVVSAGSSIGKSTAQSDRPAVLLFDSLWSLTSQYQDLSPAIIPPTYAKLKKRDWLQAIWAAAFEALRNAKVLVFIGYSLPNSDGFMRAMIRGALAIRTQTEALRVFVVDPDPHGQALARYKELFRPLGLEDGRHLHATTFEEALPFLSSILSEA